MVGPQPARYRLAVGSGQKSGRVGLRFYDPSAPLIQAIKLRKREFDRLEKIQHFY